VLLLKELGERGDLSLEQRERKTFVLKGGTPHSRMKLRTKGLQNGFLQAHEKKKVVFCKKRGVLG
jgi:hypothetical protein